ncbi:hypothetical protein G6F23_014490 [Rhizopus arrhizus]|nr:hypothetical protein G6F23_014490 [Rhizopus arrhizus]
MPSPGLLAQRAAPVTHRPVQRGGAAGARQCAVAVVAGTVIRGLAGHQGLLEAEQVAPAAGHGEAAPAVGAEGAGGVQVQPRGGQLALVGVLVGDELDASLCITLHAAGEQGCPARCGTSPGRCWCRHPATTPHPR